MKPPNLTELAKRHKTSRQTLAAWKREGFDLSNEPALVARVALKKGGAVDESMAAAKLRKARADADRCETLAAREKGLLVEAAGIRAQGEQIGFAVRAEHIRLLGDLPGRCGGRKAAEIQVILRKSFREMEANLSNFKHYANTPD